MTKKKTDLQIRKSKLGRVYFTDQTEKAIVLYNKTDDEFEREIIFREQIHPAIDKLAENVINTFKFPYIAGSFEDIKAQVVSFLVLNLHKFTEDKGKAFSYFSVIAKNYLIYHNTNSYREESRLVYINDPSTEETFPLDEILKFLHILVRYWDFNLTKIFKKKRDLDIANAIVELMRRADNIENFNKKALYLLVREMTDAKTVHVTKVINKMRPHVYAQLVEYKKTGHISDPSTFFIYNY
jgi:hypothetical protein